MDAEIQTSTRKRNWFYNILQAIRAPFTRVFWEDAFERTENETLVDAKLLSYAYLEIGLIETLAAYVLASVLR